MNTEETPKGNRIGSVLGPRLLPGHTEFSKKPLEFEAICTQFPQASETFFAHD